MASILVGDIGGTYARFGVAEAASGKGDEAGQISVRHGAVFVCADYPSAEDCLRGYLATLPTLPTLGCLAVAGPVTGDTIRLTNSPWHFSRVALQSALRLSALDIINDFAAQAAAVPYLAPSALLPLKAGEALAGAHIGLIGPGTGLGVATLARHRGQWIPVAGEGGHVRLSPVSELSMDVLRVLHRTHDYVSMETVLCGPGLVNLYRAIAEIQGQTPADYSPQQITALGVSGEDALCALTLTEFCGLLGSAAGDLALTSGAKGGIYLTGGILPRIAAILADSPLIPAFLDKGNMSHYMESIPVSLITQTNPALIGAAAWMLSSTEEP